MYLSQLIFKQKYSNRHKNEQKQKKWKKFASLKCLLLTFTDIKIHYELWATDRICLFKISSTLVVLLMNWNALLRNKRDKNRVKADTKEMETRKKTVKWHTNEKLCVCKRWLFRMSDEIRISMTIWLTARNEVVQVFGRRNDDKTQEKPNKTIAAIALVDRGSNHHYLNIAYDKE